MYKSVDAGGEWDFALNVDEDGDVWIKWKDDHGVPNSVWLHAEDLVFALRELGVLDGEARHE